MQNANHTESVVYTKQNIPFYAGNPLIEALPPILEMKDVERALQYFPDLSGLSQLSSVERCHAVECLEDLFVPLPRQYELVNTISIAIRNGYRKRNPVETEFWNRAHANAQEIRRTVRHSQVLQEGRALLLTGTPGCSKTRSVDRILGLYPQVLHHTNYHGESISFQQLVYLKMPCQNTAVKSLGTTFFKEVDRVLGTRYFFDYGKNRSVDDILYNVALVAQIHGLGLLVIDEAQHLSSQTGGAELLLNFLVTLINTAGVPVLLIGTGKASKVLNAEFRHARRLCTYPQLEFLRFKFNVEWEYFLKKLFAQNVLKETISVTPELSTPFYDLTQGIISFAVHLFIKSQALALALDSETLTLDVIRQAAERLLAPSASQLKALREGTPEDLVEFSDIPMAEFDVLEHANQVKTTATKATPHEAPPVPVTTGPENQPNQAKEKGAKKREPQKCPASETLSAYVEEGLQIDRSPYDSLVSHDVIVPLATILGDA